MTDNRTTELLRKLLDERGVEYKSHYLNTSWYAGMKLYMATDDAGGTLTVDNLTPEQAIAATLGDGDYELKMDELLCRLTNGKWSKSRSYSVDFMAGCVDEAYEDATLGVGECELIYGETDEGMDSWFTQCGGRFAATFEDGRMVHPKFCQLCGRKAVER